RVFQKRLDSASLVLQRTIAAVRFVCTDRLRDRRALRTLAVDRLVHLSLDRLALERPRRADAMKTVCQIELRSGCEYDNRREHRAVFHRFRIALDELVVVTTHLRRALGDHISQGYLNHRNLRRRVPVVLMPLDQSPEHGPPTPHAESGGPLMPLSRRPSHMAHRIFAASGDLTPSPCRPLSSRGPLGYL